MTAAAVFQRSVQAIRDGALIKRVSTKDKEFHFQNWFEQRLEELGSPFEVGGRNSYPDFRMVGTTDGFELKGLAYPGRDATFDSNSQMPTGRHNGRDIYYAFGRYPAKPDGDEYPVVDLVICHGDFLNADHDYAHKNKSVKRFGSYGDIMIRDRKMYVVPTPFRLIDGAAHRQTLVLPADVDPGEALVAVGDLVREEARELMVGYAFDLRTNALTPTAIPNPRVGQKHAFRAWRVPGPGANEGVSLRPFDPTELEVEEIGDDADG
jgi:hypothetical protein